MKRVIVGKWGQNLAIRIPFEIVRAANLRDGEDVEIETVDGNILIRRFAARSNNLEQAHRAADEIVADSEGRSLNGVTLRELRDEGRHE